MSFTFKGIRKNYIFSANIRRPTTHDDEIQYLEIKNRPGALIKKRKVKMRSIPVEIWVSTEGFSSLESLEENLADWLWSEGEEELIFDDNPNRIYYATAKIVSKPIAYTHSAKIDLVFTCSGGFKNGSLITKDFLDGSLIINNSGSVEAFPIYEIDVNEPVTHVDIIGDNGYFRIGQPEPIDRPVYQRTSLIANYPLTSLVGWSTASDVDNGYVAGTMIATPTGFRADTFGAAISPSKWQGPAVRRSLPEPLQNFRIDLEVELLNASAQTGMIELYMKDAGGNTVAKIGVEDIWNSLAKVQGKFQVGNVNNRVVDYRRIADTESAWNNYKGMIRLHRDGNRFRPYFALIRPDGKHVWTSQEYVYTDQKGDFLAPIVEVVIAIRKWPNTTHAEMLTKNLKVYRYNSEPEGVPIIANAGDKVVIDTNDSSIRINGEDRKSLKDFGVSFFKLKKGVNAILLEPADKLSGQIRYRERYR